MDLGTGDGTGPAGNGTAAAMLLDGGLAGEAQGGSALLANLGGILQVFGTSTESHAGPEADLGGTTFQGISAGSARTAVALSLVTTGLGESGVSGSGFARPASLTVHGGLAGGSDGASGTADATLNAHGPLGGGSAGSAASTGAISAVSQIVGHSGVDLWQRPQIAGESDGAVVAVGSITITGAPSVALSGST